jgi:5-methylthioadenosine/S-adenosylhomocysteine deaminase
MGKKMIVLKDADFVVKDFSKIEKSLSVAIQENLIIDVDRFENLEQKYSFDEVHDCHGQGILPGLINCHTHISETLMRGIGHNLGLFDWCNKLVFPMGKKMDSEGEEFNYRLAQLTAMEAVASGTTAIIENSVNFGKRHAYTFATALRDFGIRGAVAKSAENYSSIDYGHVGSTEREIKETENFLQKWSRPGTDLIKAWIGPSGAIRVVGGCTSDLLRELKSLANSFHTRYHLHLAANKAEVELVKKETGYPGGIAYVNGLGLLDERTSLVHCVWIAEEEKQMLKATGAGIVHCPSSAQIFAMGVQPLMKLLEQGTVCALGTDGAISNDSLDMFREMRQAVLLQLINAMKNDAMTHFDAFRMATEFGARVLGIENLGKIEKGYLADLVTLRIGDNTFLTPLYDPLETLVYACSGGRDVAMTIVNGKVLYKNGEFKTVEAEKIVSRIREDSCRIRKSLSL